ncbi:hypothetical protein GCM10023214_05410 [Amycolatopsis dongchuanensis]|uniref:Integrase n=1 Tax=Amycolatopsis dongchuanensis TaxID=1070866 RepID=A0ABP9PVT5_9PSEU
MSWFDLTCRYVDMKWPVSAATARQTTAEALIRVMPAFVPKSQKSPEAKKVRSALRQWAYNTELRSSEELPREVDEVLRWCSKYSLPVRSVLQADTLRELERAVTRRLDGKPFAPVDSNPLKEVKWTSMPKGRRKVDKRAVPNPTQARTLLAAVREVPRSGPRSVAFFATMYYTALRPEAAALNRRNLALPDPVWNEEAPGGPIVVSLRDVS